MYQLLFLLSSSHKNITNCFTSSNSSHYISSTVIFVFNSDGTSSVVDLENTLKPLCESVLVYSSLDHLWSFGFNPFDYLFFISALNIICLVLDVSALVLNAVFIIGLKEVLSISPNSQLSHFSNKSLLLGFRRFYLLPNDVYFL